MVDRETYASFGGGFADRALHEWGFVPVVVAKCGLYLKKQGTPGDPSTFHADDLGYTTTLLLKLEYYFDRPPQYGKSLDWENTSYTAHDIASLFLLFLIELPYLPMRNMMDGTLNNRDEIIAAYKALIRAMPRENSHLLIYVLDLLSGFARDSASELAAIFRPALFRHSAELTATHDLDKRVVKFLIENWKD
ncbi:hypothetical protein FB45DRAFT_1067976 [Roridomyces roridus]|uniref:Rho-GAP domain-containing protein n=1 Tax=Roridomyces roridus TaxID=1738132 RepID=A0AAD7F9R1_9AGAR|nr:hypothetical protein FB45DRAFT_1067976 [Roridomyces roridus]